MCDGGHGGHSKTPWRTRGSSDSCVRGHCQEEQPPPDPEAVVQETEDSGDSERAPKRRREEVDEIEQGLAREFVATAIDAGEVDEKDATAPVTTTTPTTVTGEETVQQAEHGSMGTGNRRLWTTSPRK